MELKRKIAGIAFIAAAAIVLTGCSNGTDTTPPEDPIPTNVPALNIEGADIPAGDEVITEPGTQIEPGEWLTHEFISFDGNKAILQSRIGGVVNASPEQIASFAEFSGQALDGKDVKLITIEQKKVSGQSIAFSVPNNEFTPAVNGMPANTFSTMGWEGCASEPYSIDFDLAQASSTTCLISIVDPAMGSYSGVLFTGDPLNPDSPYSFGSGDPVLLKS